MRRKRAQIRDKIQSKLNNFREYTILNVRNLTEYIGFTADEVRALCEEYGMDYKECKSWYDGYAQNGYELYNPESVVMCMEDKRYLGYWSQTSTYLAILDRIRENFEGIREDVVRMVAGEKIDVNVSGFTKAVAKALDESHIHVTSNRSYNNEDALQSAIYLAYIYAINRYFIFREVTAGRGARRPVDVCSARTGAEAETFADVIFVSIKGGNPDTPAMVIELKRNDCTESAIGQIERKEYFKALDGYEGKLLFVGINYDEKEKTHSAQIEEFVM